MAEAESKSIHSLVRELQSLVKNAQEHWGINFPRQGQGDKSQTNIAVVNAVHPFGPVNLNELFEEIPQKIALIREIIAKFKNDVLTGASPLQPGSEQSLKNYINQLRVETERLDSLSEVKDNIEKCKNLALDACQDNATAFKFIIQQIESFGKRLGLQTMYEYERHGTESTLTMSGLIIVLDIKYDQTSNRIIKVGVAYPPDARYQKYKDDHIDNLLTQQLSDFKQFNLFKKNLETLATLEAMSKLIQQADCFHCIKCISNDIEAIYQKEFDVTIGDVSKILTEGHGIPLFHVERVGPSIAYWAPKYRINEIDWKIIKDIMIQGEAHESFRSLHRMWITMEKSRALHPFLPPDRNRYLFDETDDNEMELMENYFLNPEMIQFQFSLLPTLKFLHPKPVEASTVFISALIEFVVWLDPPVYVTDNVARAIGDLTGVESRGHFISSAFQKKDPQALSLEQLLIKGIVSPKQSSSSRDSKIIHQWEKKFDDSPYHQVFNLDGTCHTNARRIDRIPFYHPCQVFGFIKILRQQLVFNTLYQSCFNSSTYKQITITRPSNYDHVVEETSPDAEAEVQIKVQTNNPPNGLSLSIQLPPKITSSQTTIHLQITILQQDPQPYIISHITGFGDISKFNLDDQELTGVLQMYQDIPMLINWLLNNLLKTPNVEIKLENLEDNKMMIDEVDPLVDIVFPIS